MSRNGSYYTLLKDYFALQESLGQFDHLVSDSAKLEFLTLMKAFMINYYSSQASIEKKHID
jgi:hypothetical protein